MTPAKVLKLCDFGSAYQFAGAYDLSRTSCGTPFYLAPEMINPKQQGYAHDFCTAIFFTNFDHFSATITWWIFGLLRVCFSRC